MGVDSYPAVKQVLGYDDEGGEGEDDDGGAAEAEAQRLAEE